MPLICPVQRLILVIMVAGSVVLSGCSYIPWIGDNEDDLAFEEDFPFDDIEDDRRGRKEKSTVTDEDDFFAEDFRGSRDDDFSKDDSSFELHSPLDNRKG